VLYSLLMYSGVLRMPLSAVAAGLLFAAVFILALPLPLGEIGPPFGHQALVALALGLVLALAAVLFFIKFRSIYWPASPVLWAAVSLAAAAAVSAALAGVMRLGWWGLGFEEGTVGFFVVFALLVFAAGAVPREAVRMLLYWSAGCLAVAAAGFLAGVTLFGSEAMAERWPQGAFLFALGLVLAALLFEQTNSLRGRLALLAGALVLALGLAVFFHPVAAAALVATLFLAGAAALSGREHRAPIALIPLIVVLFVAGLFLFGMRAPLLAVPPEVRPSLELTHLVVGGAYSESLRSVLVGSGPRSFAAVWESNRLPEINRSIFSDNEFNNGYSSAVTTLIALGALGFAAFVACVGMAAVMLYKSVAPPPGRNDPLMLICAALALYCFLTPFVAVPGAAVLLFGALFLGLAARLSEHTERIVQIKRGVLRGLFVALPLLLVGVVLVSTAARQYAAAAAHREGLGLLLEGSTSEAAARLTQAAEFWPVQQYERDAARSTLESVFAGLAEVPEAQAPDEEEFHALTQDARALVDKSASGKFTDWRSWLACSSLYVSLYTAAGPTYAPEYKARAVQCLEQAAQRAPTRPDVPYAQARAAIVFNERDVARGYLAEALRLKPDYAPALELQQALGQ
jgi:hypothetical protein